MSAFLAVKAAGKHLLLRYALPSGGGGALPAPTGLVAISGNGEVLLRWSAAAGAVTYNVYGSTSPGGESPIPIQTGITGLSTTLTGLSNGTTYYFKVAAVNGGGTGPQSAELSETPVGTGTNLPATVDLDIGIWHNPISVFGSPVVSAQNGNWSSGSTWVGGVVPSTNSVVQVKHDVTVDTTGLIAKHIVVEDVGWLRWADGAQLAVGSLAVAGKVIMGISGTPLNVGTSLTIRNIAADPTNDPDDMWVGIINFTGSRWTSWGTSQTVTHLRMADAVAGATTITLDAAPTGFRIGDRLYLPGMRRLMGLPTQANAGDWHQEYRTIAGISGATITLDSALTYDHLGMSSPDMLYTWQPVIQNLSRSVVVKSESATGNRGYWFCIDRADIGTWYTEFRDLTRTVFNSNPAILGPKLGRHALTFYDYIGPVGGSKQVAGSSASVHGNSFTADPTTGQYWGPTWFSSNFVHFHRNDINGFFGSGPCCFEGPECYNLFKENRSMNISGTGDREAFGGGDNNKLRAQGGDGFYWRAGLNYMQSNVAANCNSNSGAAIGEVYSYGFLIHSEFLYNNANEFSLIPSGPTAVGEVPATQARVHNFATLQFDDNEAFSCSGGFTFWWINLDQYAGTVGCENADTVFSNMRFWNTQWVGAWPYETNRLVIDNYTYINSGYGHDSNAWGGSDYDMHGNMTIKNSHLYGRFYANVHLFPEQSDFRFGDHIRAPFRYITGITNAAGKVQIAFNFDHGLNVNDRIRLYGTGVAGYDSQWGGHPNGPTFKVTSVTNATTVVTDQNFTSTASDGEWGLLFGSDYQTETVKDTLVASLIAQPQAATGLFTWQQELNGGRELILDNVTFLGAVDIYVNNWEGNPNEGANTIPNFVKVISFNGAVGSNFYINTLFTLRNPTVEQPEAAKFGAALTPISGITGTIYAMAAP